MKLMIATLGVAIWLALVAVPATAVTLGQVDTFGDGTVQGWNVGAPSPVPPVNVANGGPTGTHDNFLKLTSNGGRGPGSKLVAMNEAQWTGDYIAAGVSSISMDVSNLGHTNLSLRLVFANEAGGSPLDIAISNAIIVPANSGWTNVAFNIDPAQLTPEVGTATGALKRTTELRLYHGLTATSPGTPSVSQLGVDNIRAVGHASTVPEPSSLALLGAGITGVFARRRRTHR